MSLMHVTECWGRWAFARGRNGSIAKKNKKIGPRFYPTPTNPDISAGIQFLGKTAGEARRPDSKKIKKWRGLVFRTGQ
jgi:hypothetical protein